MRTATPDDAERLADLLLRGGEDLHTLETPPALLAREIGDLEHWIGVLDEAAGGALLLDVGDRGTRAWAWGPVVQGDGRDRWADAALDHLLERLPSTVRRVAAFPRAGTWLEAWWRGRGATPSSRVHVYGTVAEAGPVDPRVRPVREADLPALRALHDLTFPDTYLSAEAMLAGPGRVLVAGESRLDGYLYAELRDDGTGYVHYVAVDPERRGQGLGTALLRASLAWLAGREVTLTVADDNAARRLYDRAGFALRHTGQPFDLAL